MKYVFVATLLVMSLSVATMVAESDVFSALAGECGVERRSIF